MRIVCKYCGYLIVLDRFVDGLIVCPNCGKVIEVI